MAGDRAVAPPTAEEIPDLPVPEAPVAPVPPTAEAADPSPSESSGPASPGWSCCMFFRVLVGTFCANIGEVHYVYLFVP